MSAKAIDTIEVLFNFDSGAYAEKIANANIFDKAALVFIGNSLATGLMDSRELGHAIVTDVKYDAVYQDDQKGEIRSPIIEIDNPSKEVLYYDLYTQERKER